jgi:CubicO group peptidase (beta-lactamase class C family)
MSTALCQQADPEDVGMSSAHLGNIDSLQERYLAENAYQGSVVLVARHGKVRYFKAFGKADEGVPMATDSIFRLASMSKVVAAACIMQLFEQAGSRCTSRSRPTCRSSATRRSRWSRTGGSPSS